MNGKYKNWNFLPEITFCVSQLRITLLNINFSSGWCSLILLKPLTKTRLFLFFFSFTALLAGTLRTYQKAGCDAEYMALNCPRGTSISIEIAQYGNTLKGTFNSNDYIIHLDFILKLPFQQKHLFTYDIIS